MPQILFVQSTLTHSEAKDSHSELARKMSRHLKDSVRMRGTYIVNRDIATNPPTLVDCYWKNAAKAPDNTRTDDQKQRLKESDELVKEVLHSDVIVVSCPVYDYGMPAPLTAWLDNLDRPGKTYTFSERRPNVTYGLLHNKKVVVLMSESEKKTPQKTGRGDAQAIIKHRFEQLGVHNFEFIKVDENKYSDPNLQGSEWTSTQHQIATVAQQIQTRWKSPV